MSEPNRRRNPVFWIGVALAVMTALAFTLNLTAVPVVMDVPLVTLVIATLASATLLIGVLREIRRPTGARRAYLVLGSAALLMVLMLTWFSIQKRFLSYQAHEAHFSNNAVNLAGTLYSPRSRGPHPAVVFVHGSGPEPREEYGYFAAIFAKNGLAGLAYDKRGAGQSSGELYESDYHDYAKDVLAAVEYLKRLDQVDAECIGLVGFSEGEWVAALAASLSDDVAFLVVIAPSGVSPAAQVNQEIAYRLRSRGYSSDDVERALALNNRVFEYQRTGQAPIGLAEDLRTASIEPWFQDARDIPAGLDPPDEYQWWRSVMDFAPGPVWKRVKKPVLLLKGGKDPNSEAGIARQEIEAALKSGDNDDVKFVLFPDGDHAMLRWPFGERIPPPMFVSGYPMAMVQWARELPCVRRLAAQ